MKRIGYIVMVCWLALTTAGCSLLEIKLESGIEPLPTEQLNMRVLSRDYVQSFYSQVETTADYIAAQDPTIEQRANALMWKIYAEQTIQRSIFQPSPVAALIDTWVFVEQQQQFFSQGAGKYLFGSQQDAAVAVSESLTRQFRKSAKGLLSNQVYTSSAKFVEQYVATHPFTDISFSRQSAFTDYLTYRKIGEFDVIKTFGTVPEVMSDISDRMSMISQQTPKILGWKAELFALHSNINTEELQKTLEDISVTSAKFQKLMAQSPEMMATLAVDMRRELTPLLDQVSKDTDNKLAQLTEERKALQLMVTSEREALERMVTREREAAKNDINQIADHAVKVVFEQITNTIKSVIVYFILFLLVVFFAPLGLGVWLGKRMATKKANKAS